MKLKLIMVLLPLHVCVRKNEVKNWMLVVADFKDEVQSSRD